MNSPCKGEDCPGKFEVDEIREDIKKKLKVMKV